MGWMDDAIQNAQPKQPPQPSGGAGGWMDKAIAQQAVKSTPVQPPNFNSAEAMNEVSAITDDLERVSLDEGMSALDYMKRKAYGKDENGLRAMPMKMLCATPGGADDPDNYAPLSPEDQYKADLSGIRYSIHDPAEQEKAIRERRLEMKKKLFNDRVAPVQQYYSHQLVMEHDAEKQGSRMAEWLDAWDRGSARIASGATKVFGADDWARAYHLASTAPELAPSLDQDWVDKAINMVGETAPYMVVTTAAAVATGGAAGVAGASSTFFGALGGGVVSFGVEGNGAYQTAIDNDVDEERARAIGFQVGLVNAVIESVGGSGSKFFRRGVKKGFTNRMKAAGKWTTKRVKTALAEALEEAGQEASSMIGEAQYRDIKGAEVVDRVLVAGSGGFLLGGAMDLSIGTASRMGAQKAADEAGEKYGTEQRRALNKEVSAAEAAKEATAKEKDGGKQRADAVQPAPTGQDYYDAMGRAINGDEDAQRLIKEAELTDDTEGNLILKESDEGTLAAAGILRNLGAGEDIQIGMSEEARTMADQIEDGYETTETATQALVDGGLDPTLPPEQTKVVGRNFRDTMNRVVIELHQGHDAGTLLHEASEAYYRGVWGDEFETKATSLRREYEERTGETHDGSTQEWLADMAVDYAVHNKIHERAGMSIRRMFNKYRQVFKRMLARAINLRKHIADGNVPAELQKMLDDPFAGRGTDVQAKSDGKQTYKLAENKLRSSARTIDTIGDAQKAFILSDGGVIPFTAQDTHDEYASRAQVSIGELVKEGTLRLTTHGSQLAVEFNGAMSDVQKMKIRQWAVAHAKQQGSVQLVIEDATGTSYNQTVRGGSDASKLLATIPGPGELAKQTYKLSGPEQKIMDKYGGGKVTDEKLFVASDGTMLKVDRDHADAAKNAGTTMRTVLRNGSMRLFRSDNQHAVELGGTKPITDEQAATLQKWLTRNFSGDDVVTIDPGDASMMPMEFLEQRSDIPGVISNIRKSVDASFLQTTGYKLERADNAAPSHGQRVEGHVIPERLKMTEDQRRDFMEAHTGKRSMKEMTHGEAKVYIEALQSAAKAKKIKLNTMNTMADALAGIIEDHNALDTTKDNGLDPRGLRAMFKGGARKVSWYLQNQTRIERMLHALNGHEKGSLYNQVWMDVKESNEMATVNSQDIAMELQAHIASRGTKSMKSMLSRKPIEIFERPANDKNSRHRGNLTASERMSLYMLAKNENGQRHITAGNGYTDAELATVFQWMKKRSPDEINVAEYMLGVYKKQFEAFSISHKAATGQTLTEEDMYSPLYLSTVGYNDTADYLQDLLNLKDFNRPNMTVGESEDRTRGASQPVKLNAFDNFLHNTERIARYTAMAPTIVRVGKILSNRNFKEKVNQATNGYGSEILQKWLKDSARGFAADSRAPIDRIARTYRKNSMVYVLGYKIPSALRQTLSVLPAMAKSPAMIPLVIRNVSMAPAFTPMFRKMADEVYGKSNMMRTRNWDRVEGFVNRAKRAEKRIAGKKTLDERALSMVKFLDKHTTVYAWQAAYQLASRTMGEKAAIAEADSVVERTQPMGNAINLPAFFRGGALAQLLTTFENQINQNYNFWAHDIAGEYKAGKISGSMVAYRALMSYIIPAMLMGAIGRGELPEEPGEIITDLVTYPIAGAVMFGRWINGAIRGFGNSGTIIDVAAKEFSGVVAELKKDDPDFLKATWKTARTAGAMTGKVPQQVFNTAEVIAQPGGPKYMRELIYGTRYARQRDQADKQRR